MTGMDGLYAFIFARASIPLILVMRISIRTKSKGGGSHLFNRVLTVIGGVDSISPAAGDRLQGHQMTWVVVNYQDAVRPVHVHASLPFFRKRRCIQAGSSLSCLCRGCFQRRGEHGGRRLFYAPTASPNPVPLFLVVKYGSKIRVRWSAAMPGPVSLTQILA